MLCAWISGCSPNLSADEVMTVFWGNPRPGIAGLDVGDSWETVKQNHDSRFKLSEDSRDGVVQGYLDQ